MEKPKPSLFAVYINERLKGVFTKEDEANALVLQLRSHRYVVSIEPLYNQKTIDLLLNNVGE